ncbi:unnamed protein product [Closterium sp. NIES-54]
MGHVALPILQQLVKNEMVAGICVKGEPDESPLEQFRQWLDLRKGMAEVQVAVEKLKLKANPVVQPWRLCNHVLAHLGMNLGCLGLTNVKRAILQEDFCRRELASADGAGATSIGQGYGRGRGRGRGGARFGSNKFSEGCGSGGYGSDNKSYGRSRGRFDGECHYCHKSGHIGRDCYKLSDGWNPSQGQEGRGAGGGRGRGHGGRGGRRGGAASMKSAGNNSDSRDVRFPGQFFFVSTQASAGPEKDKGFEEPAAVRKVTLYSLDYWVIDSGATYSMTPRADLLTELEPSPVKHVTSAFGQRAEVKGMRKAMFKGADGKMVGLKNQRQGLHVPAADEEGRGKRRIQAPNRLTYDALGKPAKSALAGAALMVGDDKESDYEECAFTFFSPVEMPGKLATLKEALQSSDAEEWKKAMEIKLKSIKENGTWELVELPEGRKAITSKWLFKIQSDADGKIECYKSRLVAKGYQQKEKVDYKELFAPVVKPMTLRTLLAGAAIKGWVVKQMDVTTAFLNGILKEEIFMAQPEGFDVLETMDGVYED